MKFDKYFLRYPIAKWVFGICALLLCLMRNRNTVLSREQLLVKCWGYDYEGEARAVDTHIKRLREKLGDAASIIRTVIKAGYVLEV